MKKFRNNSARASALQVTMAIAALAVSAILLAANFKAAPADDQQSQSVNPAKDKVSQVEADAEAAAIEKAKQSGFYPPLPQAPAPELPQDTSKPPIVFGPGCVTTTFPGTGVGAIPDGGSGTPPIYGTPLVISFVVSGMTAPLSSVSSDITLTHSWCGDIDMVLAAPGGAASLITASHIGVTTAGSFGDSSDFAGTYNFTDTAAGTNIWTVATAAGGAAAIAPGNYRSTAGGGAGQVNPAPVTNLTATFAGLSTVQVNGTWTLTIRDGGASDTGSVTAANLTLSSAGCVTPTPAPTPTPTASPSPVPTAAPSPVPCQTYTNSTAITILDNQAAAPYPSNIAVSGLGGTVTFVGVRLNGIAQSFPDDVDIMLVGPGGQTATIMSDVGGSTLVSGINLALYDLAVTPIPDAGPLVSGSFAPTNVDTTTDVFPAPAPASAGGSSLGVFNGTNPNGTWNLYVRDDAGGDTGAIAGGWDLLILTTDCAGPTATPNPTPTPFVTPTPAPTASPAPTATATGTPPATVCQLPTEDFANINTLVPGGWVMKNNSSPLGATGWSQGSTVVFNAQAGAPTAYISANYNNTGSVGTISNWLLTPPVTIQNGAQFSFWTQAAGDFADRLQVRMSTSGTSANVGATATDVGDFTTLLLDINPAYDLITYPVGFWQNYLVTITGVGSPVKGRIAFRYFVENAGALGANSNYIGIDTVWYDCNGGATPAPTPTPLPPTPTPTPSGTPTPAPTPTATPCPMSTTVLSQDFEAGLGAWTIDNATTVSACPTAVDWTVRTNPYDPSSAGCGGSAAQTPLNSGGGTSFAMSDSDAGGSGVLADARLNSPSFNTVGMSTLRLSYRHFYRALGSSVGAIEVSISGAAGPWVNVKSVTTTQGASAAFVADSVVLDAFVGNADTRIRFRYTAGWDWWWAIDDVLLTTCTGSTVTISGKVGNCSSPAPTATPPATPTPPVLPGSPNVLMTLSGSSSGTTLTDASGNYSFTVNAGGTYTVTPSKASIPAAGPNINNLDVLAVQRHFLLITQLAAGCRLTAADANVNAIVNSQDVLAIQRFFLGFTSGTGSVGQYKFVPASRSYPAIAGNQTAQNYEMYVVGDAAAAFNNRPGENENDMGFSTVAFVALPDVAPSRSMSNFAAPVTTSAVDASERVVGFQGDFTFDERAVKFANEPVEKAGLTAGNWNVTGNVLPGNGPIRTLRISAYSTDFSPLSGAGTLFMLKMVRVTQSGEGTPLVWAAAPNNFIFINADLETQRPGDSAAGSVSSSIRDR